MYQTEGRALFGRPLLLSIGLDSVASSGSGADFNSAFTGFGAGVGSGAGTGGGAGSAGVVSFFGRVLGTSIVASSFTIDIFPVAISLLIFPLEITL